MIRPSTRLASYNLSLMTLHNTDIHARLASRRVQYAPSSLGPTFFWLTSPDSIDLVQCLLVQSCTKRHDFGAFGN
jgi:hypothetical protein